MTKSLRKICGWTEDRTCNLNTSRTAYPTVLVTNNEEALMTLIFDLDTDLAGTISPTELFLYQQRCLILWDLYGFKAYNHVYTVKPDLKTTSFKRLSLLRDHFQILPRVRTIIMPPTSNKLRGHIGLGLSVAWWVAGSVRYACVRSRTVKGRILKFNMWNKPEK